MIIYLPRRRSLSSRLASRLSLRNCRSISWLILFCSLASSDRQHAMIHLDRILGVRIYKWELFKTEITCVFYQCWCWWCQGDLMQGRRRLLPSRCLVITDIISMMMPRWFYLFFYLPLFIYLFIIIIVIIQN